ncbi:R3H domain-containing nucleic acid-binding protein [Patulibacter brassicae]|uniref:R3H domain-containing nucleic acid-binding protein n=1 Tax=Patulibacter brassicae TaxID=1705717 RepID=A0ABU4VKU4_9ACTN|nr:R3H domain-containing nucleic acid-binding protein [Patulibacter brassicae]MDX8152469.1 R3H domain-containing nucleic acid-binding protein [Patulibacter brassicae]
MARDDEAIGERIAVEVGAVVGRVALGLGAGDDVDVTREGNRITATLRGDGVAPFIGRHGQVIDAVQHLATRVAAKHAPGGDWVVTVDAGDYRSRRASILERIAMEAADRAVGRGEAVALDPMTASERRHVHERLRDRGDVTTHSEGDEPERHLVVTPKRP